MQLKMERTPNEITASVNEVVAKLIAIAPAKDVIYSPKAFSNLTYAEMQGLHGADPEWSVRRSYNSLTASRRVQGVMVFVETAPGTMPVKDDDQFVFAQ